MELLNDNSVCLFIGGTSILHYGKLIHSETNITLEQVALVTKGVVFKITDGIVFNVKQTMINIFIAIIQIL